MRRTKLQTTQKHKETARCIPKFILTVTYIPCYKAVFFPPFTFQSGFSVRLLTDNPRALSTASTVDSAAFCPTICRKPDTVPSPGRVNVAFSLHNGIGTRVPFKMSIDGAVSQSESGRQTDSARSKTNTLSSVNLLMV